MRRLIHAWLLIMLTVFASSVAVSTSKRWRIQDGDTRNLIQHDNPELPIEHTTTIPSLFLHKRLDNYPMANGWQLEVGTYDSMLPTETAAITLEKFYDAVIWRSMVHSNPESNFYRLRAGHLALEFFCRQSPIPWALVRNFARIMAAGARQGFTGRYEMYYINVQAGLSIAISLYVFL